MGKSQKNKRKKKYVMNKESNKNAKSSKMNTWILVAMTVVGAGVVIYLS